MWAGINGLVEKVVQLGVLDVSPTGDSASPSLYSAMMAQRLNVGQLRST